MLLKFKGIESMDRLIVDYLIDMLDAMHKAEGFISGMEYDVFRNDDKTIFATVRALEIVGEAAKHIPDQFR